MSDQAQASQQSTQSKQQAKQAAAPAPKTPGMSTNEHTTFVELLLQNAADAARRANAQFDSKDILLGATEAVDRVQRVVSEYSIPGTGVPSKQLLTSVDAAFMALFNLSVTMRDSADPATAAYAKTINSAVAQIEGQFEPLGWKRPESMDAGRARATKADKAGAARITDPEKAKLGRLHIRAARQHILGSWPEIIANNLSSLAPAAENLRDATAILIDPNLDVRASGIANELEATDQVLNRLVMVLEKNHPAALASLHDMAKSADSLLAVAGREPKWAARLNASAPETKPGQQTTTPVATGAAQTGAGLPGAEGEAPRAEPAMHRPIETRTWKKKVHLKDTNYFDEYLGYVELFMEVIKTASGQVYVQRARATKIFDSRAAEYLSIGADVAGYSMQLNGQNYADVYFDVQIGGPNKTETSTVNASFKLGGSNTSKTSEAEGSVGVTFSTAVTSQGTRHLRRVFRVSGLNKPLKTMQYDPATYTMKEVETGMVIDERKEHHMDFSNFELDDDHVGDHYDTLYANWVLQSYSD